MFVGNSMCLDETLDFLSTVKRINLKYMRDNYFRDWSNLG